MALPQTPLGELTALPIDPLAASRGLLLREEKGRGEEGMLKGRKGEGGGRIRPTQKFWSGDPMNPAHDTTKCRYLVVPGLDVREAQTQDSITSCSRFLRSQVLVFRSRFRSLCLAFNVRCLLVDFVVL